MHSAPGRMNGRTISYQPDP